MSNLVIKESSESSTLVCLEVNHFTALFREPLEIPKKLEETAVVHGNVRTYRDTFNFHHTSRYQIISQLNPFQSLCIKKALSRRETNLWKDWMNAMIKCENRPNKWSNRLVFKLRGRERKSIDITHYTIQTVDNGLTKMKSEKGFRSIYNVSLPDK